MCFLQRIHDDCVRRKRKRRRADDQRRNCRSTGSIGLRSRVFAQAWKMTYSMAICTARGLAVLPCGPGGTNVQRDRGRKGWWDQSQAVCRRRLSRTGSLTEPRGTARHGAARRGTARCGAARRGAATGNASRPSDSRCALGNM